MIQRVLAGTVSEEDVAQAQAMGADDRKKLVDRLTGTIEDKLGEALVLEDAMEDVSNALRQARPVFAAGLSIDQALGFIIKMVEESLDDLESAGGADSTEYEKQELVLAKLNGIVAACNESGNTQGLGAQECAHLEYRGEVGKLEALKSDAENSIANTLGFLRTAFSDGNETAAFARNLTRRPVCARYIDKFGSPSFFAYKHVAAPGEIYHADSDSDKEGD